MSILVIVGGEAGGRWLGIGRQLRAVLLSPLVGQKLGMFVNSENHEDMLVLAELIEAGKVVPAIERTYPLSEAPEAIQHLEDGKARGKLVITLAGSEGSR